jgi:hypothetical protein
MIMSADAKLEILNNQIRGQSFGPLDTLFDQIVSMLRVATRSLAGGLRQAANDQPLTTLLLASQAGYLVARMGQRRARG